MASQPPRIRPEEVHQKLHGGGTLLVCAYENEDKNRAFRLAGAITLQELESRRDEGLDRGTELVFYCACENDELATEAARAWSERGFTNAKVLSGGVERWKAAGYDMAQPHARPELDHTPEPAPLGPKPKVEAGAEPLPPRQGQPGQPVGYGAAPERFEGEEAVEATGGEGGMATSNVTYGSVDDGGAGLSQADESGDGDRVIGGEPVKVRDFMTRSPEVISSDSSVAEAARRMRDLDIGALPVCDAGRRFIGMVTDRDITVRVTAEGKDPSSTTLQSILSGELVTCDEDADVVDVARLMQERHIRRVPIVRKGDEAKGATDDIVGIISLDDLATDLRVSEIVARTLARTAGEKGR